MKQGDPFDTPVALILFNRPHRSRELVQTLRVIQPSRILAIADGPRASHPADPTACRLARAVLDEIDWPCSIEREFSESNLGCDQRIVTGLDWAFSRVDRAIVLEDDILPHPSFLPWAAAMLDRFGHDPSVGIISGRNPLGYWGRPEQDHIRARFGGIWGWACTARAWQRIQAHNLDGDPAQVPADVGRLNLDPLLAAHWALALRMFRRGELGGWDVIFCLRACLAGLDAINSPVNLTRNTGIGPEATRTLFEDDFSALLEAREARPLRTSLAHPPADPGFDRAALMVQLLARCRAPLMAVRLARLIQRDTRVPIDEATRHHLAPFVHADESRPLLEHLAAQGLSSPSFDQLLKAVRGLSREHVTAS